MHGQSVALLGYGSLLSRESAERTFGPLPDFRVVRVPGYVRVFNKVCIHSIQSGLADAESREIGCACAAPLEGGELTAALIRLPEDSAVAFFEREREFRIVEAVYVDPETRQTGKAFLCTMWSEAEFRSSFASEADYEEKVGHHYSGRMWREDILPARAYLRCCLEGAMALGIDEKFMDETLLANRRPLREYLGQHPEVLGGSAGGAHSRYRNPDQP